MHQLTTVFCSNIPMDCHILKGRLETEGIPCFIYDENLIWVYPFRAVAIGGAKLKVPGSNLTQARKIINRLKNGQLTDENGDYSLSEIFNHEIIRQNEILIQKSRIRNDSSLINSPEKLASRILSANEIKKIVEAEKEFKTIAKRKFVFSWKQFLYELFDFERDVFRYLRPKPTDYYIEKEIVDNYIRPKESEPAVNCPNCNSDNTYFGFAIDFKWDILYLIISVMALTPLFLIRKKNHCFNCGHNF